MRNVLLSLLLCLVLAPDNARSADVLTIKVKETRLRSAPQQFASGIASLKYGDSITALSTKDDWVEGEIKGSKRGYVHITAVTAKKVVLSSNREAPALVDQSDVILAGKGFSQATEAEYARQHGAASFKAVDALEAVRISDAEIMQFMKEGQVGNAR